MGTTTVVCIATDASGNKDTCSFTVTVRDNQPPVVSCPPNLTLSASIDTCGAILNFSIPNVTDNCPDVSVSCVPPPGTFCELGIKTVICIAKDLSGNADTCSFTVTVRDLVPPVLLCPPNQTASASPGECAAVVSYPPPTVIENCPPATLSCTPPSGSSFPVGNTAVICIATDAAGNKDTCSFTVTVRDNQPPQIACPPNQEVNAGPGECAAVVSYPSATASDNCPGVTVSCTPPSGSSFPVGTTTVTCTASDASGNRATCSFTIRVRDVQPPAIVCPPNQNVGCEAAVQYSPPTASDNCPGVTVNCVPPSGFTFPVGTTTVNCRATDSSGNTATCSFTVTIRDTQPPQIVCPPNQTANAGSACVAVVSYPAPTASDNCPDITVSCTPPSGSSFPVGTTTVICIATDKSGNKDTCSFAVTVRDTQPPVVSCPPNLILSASIDTCGAILNFSIPNAVDNCPPVTVVCVPPSGTFCDIGTKPIICIATDGSGNKDTCSFTVTVRDNQPPQLVCPPNQDVNASPGECAAAVSYPPPTVIENCPPATVSCTPPSGSAFPVGTSTVICIATDAAGNKDTCSFTVRVRDTQPPTVSCPPNQDVNANPGQCAAVVSYPPPTASDNCPGVTVSCAPPSGSSFPVGTTTVRCTATDAAGNTAACSFTIKVRDVQPPAIVCPPNQNVGCEAVVRYPDPTVSDNCPGVTVSCVPPSGSSFPPGTTTVNCTVSDASGNTASCSFTVTTGEDNQPPVLVCPANLTASNAAGQCAANVSFTANASDNCPGVTIVCTPPSGSSFPVGTSTVTCVATDAVGKKDTCQFTVTVNDTEPPVAQCPANYYGITPDQCCAVVNFTANVSDNCPGATIACTPPSGTCFPVGTTIVTCIASDAAGNKDTCQFNARVVDQTPPVAQCPADISVNNDAGRCDAVVSFAVTANDDCPGVSINCAPPAGSRFPVGTTTVICIATDASGNKDTCSFSVTVRDTQPPTVSCPPNQDVNAGPGQCAAVVQYPPPTASDNCPPVTVSCSPPSGFSFPVGNSTVICIAADASGNKDTCSFTIRVRDTQPPTVNCPPNQNVGCVSVVQYPPATVSDNCPGVTVSCAPPSGSSFPPGTTTVNCTATDASENKDSCSFTVTVNENTACAINDGPGFGSPTCPGSGAAIANLFCGPGGMASYNWSVDCGTIDGSSTSQCVSWIPPASGGSCTFTLIVVDAGGCADTCTRVIAVPNPVPCGALAPPSPLPVCGSTGNSYCIRAGFTISGVTVDCSDWQVTGWSGNCFTYNAGSSAGPCTFVINADDPNGCPTTCDVSFGCVAPADFCFLLIDEETIDEDISTIEAACQFPDICTNEYKAKVGLRDPIYLGGIGTEIILPTGQVCDEGLFALKTIPESWHSAGPTPDGLCNYIKAGPGLGSGSNPEALLDKVPNVTPLREEGLASLVGTKVCAVVYDNDISINYNPLNGNLKGANLGLIALEVLALLPASSTEEGRSSSSLSAIKVRVLDPALCECNRLRLLWDEAPTPFSCGDEGCTPGFWKNHISLWNEATDAVSECVAAAIAGPGAPYSGNGTTGSSFRTTFGLTSAQMSAAGLDPSLTLLQALYLDGGNFQKLARHATAGLLNSCAVEYRLSPAQVLTQVHDAYVNLTPEPLATQLEQYNQKSCPLSTSTYVVAKAAAEAEEAGTLADKSAGQLPTEFALRGSHPNPFNASTQINFALPEKGYVRVVIFNILGQPARTLVDGELPAGERSVLWDGTDGSGRALPSGVYFYKVSFNGQVKIGKMTLLK